MRCHYGREAQVKSCVKILDLNLSFSERVDPEVFKLPFLDLKGLESEDKKKNKKRFMEMVLDLKINTRQRAFLII